MPGFFLPLSSGEPCRPYLTPTPNNAASAELVCVYTPVPVTIATPETAGVDERVYVLNPVHGELGVNVPETPDWAVAVFQGNGPTNQ